MHDWPIIKRDSALVIELEVRMPYETLRDVSIAEVYSNISVAGAQTTTK